MFSLVFNHLKLRNLVFHYLRTSLLYLQRNPQSPGFQTNQTLTPQRACVFLAATVGEDEMMSVQSLEQQQVID